MFFFLCCHRCLWFVSRWMSDEEKEEFEEINMEPTTVSVPTDWPPQIGDSNALLIPQPLPTPSRSNSISSVDYQIIDINDIDTRKI